MERGAAYKEMDNQRGWKWDVVFRHGVVYYIQPHFCNNISKTNRRSTELKY